MPRSSESRHALGHLRLLTSVDLYAPPGLQFAGQLLTPGASCDPGDLPRPAVLLECVGSVRIAPQRSRYAFAALWVLWRFDFDRGMWIEVARTTATDTSWSIHFAPLANRLLHPEPPRPAEDRAQPVGARIATLISGELALLSREVRCYVLAGLDRYLAGEIVAASSALTARPLTAAGGQRVWTRIGAHIDSEPGALLPPMHL